MLTVQKFGGTSVGNIDRIRSVAQLLAKSQQEGNDVVAVVSAMAGETNRLVGLANSINEVPWSVEYDMLLAAGEQQSVALVSLAINSLGRKSKPLLAHQVGIKTDSLPSKARIQEIGTDSIRSLLKEGVIPIIAGFQGVDAQNNITTLGRGGSDTSAVAIAAALKADDCDIFTDVDGVYTTDPRLCPSARKLPEVCHEEMIELASLGAKVLHIRSVEIAAKYRVPLHVRSSFNLVPGTRIVGERKSMEDVLVSGVAADADCAQISLHNLPDSPEAIVEIFGVIAGAGIVVDVIVQNKTSLGLLNLSFTVNEVELPKVKQLLGDFLPQSYPHAQLSIQSGLAKVSIVGVGMRNNPGVAYRAFQVMTSALVPIILVSTSEIKISMVIQRPQMKAAVEALHSGFHLDKIQF